VSLVRVAAAVVVARDGRVLLAQRPAGKVYAGYWEFPGGKLEPGESPHDALVRELSEELGLAVRRAAPWLIQRYVYPHAHVELHFFRVYAWDGEPVGHDGQAFAWQVPGRFDVAPLLPANTTVLRALVLPSVYGITMAGDLGEQAFLVRARAAFDRGLRLLQLREKDWPSARQHALEACPVHSGPLGASVEPVTPDAGDTIAKLLQSAVVAANAEVGVVSLEMTHEVPVLLVEGEMPMVSAPVRDAVESASEAAAGRRLLDHPAPCT